MLFTHTRSKPICKHCKHYTNRIFPFAAAKKQCHGEFYSLCVSARNFELLMLIRLRQYLFKASERHLTVQYTRKLLILFDYPRKNYGTLSTTLNYSNINNRFLCFIGFKSTDVIYLRNQRNEFSIPKLLKTGNP